MGETTIEWCDFTFNPWQGCQRVSPGCTNCYAEARDQRFTKGKNWGPGGARTRTSDANWRKPITWNRAAYKAQVESGFTAPRPRVFCASLADVFEDRPELIEWRAQLIDLITRTPYLDWLLLTKRPENIRRLLRETLAWLERQGGHHVFCDAAVALRLWLDGVGTDDGEPYPPPNVWLGTTVEDQQRADERIPELRRVPAAVRFLSCEPLLERVDITKALWPVLPSWPSKYASPEEARAAGATVTMRRQSLISKAWADSLVSWVIIGGESGRKARPFDVAWARDLVRQARAGGAAPFVKQLGRRPVFSQDDLYEDGPAAAVSALDEHRGGFGEWEMERLRLAGDFWLRDAAGGDMNEWPPDLRVREFPR